MDSEINSHSEEQKSTDLQLNNDTGNDSQAETSESLPKSENEHIGKKSPKTFPGVNLYVKNLDDTFTDEKLRDVFKKFGAITSTKMMFESGHPKGFGFVCFSSKEEAEQAVLQMNGRIVGSKPLYVTYAQKKEDRKAFLAKKYKEMANIAPVLPAQTIPVQPVTSPTLLPPTSPPTPTYYQVPNSPQNIQCQYFPAGVIQPHLHWSPVNVQSGLTVQPLPVAQPYITNPQTAAVGTYDNAPNALMPPQPFIWTGSAPQSAYQTYPINQPSAFLPNTGNNIVATNANLPTSTFSYVTQPPPAQSFANNHNVAGNVNARQPVAMPSFNVPQNNANTGIAVQSYARSYKHGMPSNVQHVAPQ